MLDLSLMTFHEFIASRYSRSDGSPTSPQDTVKGIKSGAPHPFMLPYHFLMSWAGGVTRSY